MIPSKNVQHHYRELPARMTLTAVLMSSSSYCNMGDTGSRQAKGHGQESFSWDKALTAPARTDTVDLREVLARMALDWADLRATFISRVRDSPVEASTFDPHRPYHWPLPPSPHTHTSRSFYTPESNLQPLYCCCC